MKNRTRTYSIMVGDVVLEGYTEDNSNQEIENKYLRCHYYLLNYGNLSGDNRCFFNRPPVITPSIAQCDHGDITTCIYKEHPRFQEMIRQKKDKALRDEEKIREFLIKIASAFGEPYR